MMGAAAGTQNQPPGLDQAPTDMRGSWEQINKMSASDSTKGNVDPDQGGEEFDLVFEAGSFGIQVRINVKQNSQIPDRFDELPGAYVKGLVSGSPASRKSLEEQELSVGTLLVGLNGEPLTCGFFETVNRLRAASSRPQTKITFRRSVSSEEFLTTERIRVDLISGQRNVGIDVRLTPKKEEKEDAVVFERPDSRTGNFPPGELEKAIPKIPSGGEGGSGEGEGESESDMYIHIKMEDEC